MRDLDRSLLKSAAQLRSALGLKTPDAIQLAAAIAGGCRVFVTQDRDFARVKSFRVVQLSELD